jgi:hypothetical protein
MLLSYSQTQFVGSSATGCLIVSLFLCFHVASLLHVMGFLNTCVCMVYWLEKSLVEPYLVSREAVLLEECVV